MAKDVKVRNSTPRDLSKRRERLFWDSNNWGTKTPKRTQEVIDALAAEQVRRGTLQEQNEQTPTERNGS